MRGLNGAEEKVLGKYFGTDGFRGRANQTLTAVHAFRIGRFLGNYFGKNGEKRARIVLGKDTRLSSYTFEYALASGATASGADVYLLHVTTTPSVSYVARTEGFDCGVMISASHNPYEDNGIKLIDDRGEKMGDDVIAEVEKMIDGGDVPLAQGDKIGRTIDYVAGRNRYLAFLLSLPRTSFRGLKIGLDCANGSAFAISKAVFDALGAQVYLTGAEPNGTNINLNCGSTCPERLQELILSQSLDMGFSFDGDADRCIAADEKGNVIDGDGILYIAANDLSARGELDGKGIVLTHMSNLGLDKALKRRGIECVRTEVGDRFVHAEMVKTGYLLGGEPSGHIIFRKHETTGDGLVTALKITETALENKCPLSCLASGYTPFPRELINVRVSHKEEILSTPAVQEAVVRAQELCRGRVLLRASGTEPLIRILAEGEKNCKESAKAMERVVKEAEERLCAES